MQDPPAVPSCHDGHDHRIPWTAGGCPGCGRLRAACRARGPCTARRDAPVRLAVRSARWRLAGYLPGAARREGRAAVIIMRAGPGAPG